MISSYKQARVDDWNDFSQHQPDVWQVYVGGIPSTATAQELKEYFSIFGPIKSVRTFEDKNGKPSDRTARIRGFCIVSVGSKQTYDAVLAFPSHSFHHRKLFCSVVKKGKELREANNTLNLRRALIKNVPLQLDERKLCQFLNRQVAPVETIYPYASDDELAYSKSSKTFSLLFKENKHLQKILLSADVALRLAPMVLIPFDHWERFEIRINRKFKSKKTPYRSFAPTPPFRSIHSFQEDPLSPSYHPTSPISSLNNRRSSNEKCDKDTSRLETDPSELLRINPNQAPYFINNYRPTQRAYHVINKTIDLANEDHRSPHAQYVFRLSF